MGNQRGSIDPDGFDESEYFCITTQECMGGLLILRLPFHINYDRWIFAILFVGTHQKEVRVGSNSEALAALLLYFPADFPDRLCRRPET